VQLILGAAKSIQNDGFKVNIASIPCLDKFYKQDQAYRDSVVDPDIPKLVVEALHPDSWQGLINLNDTIIGMKTFGESAPANELMIKFGFTEENIVTEAKKLLKK
jgi:transketolase